MATLSSNAEILWPWWRLGSWLGWPTPKQPLPAAIDCPNCRAPLGLTIWQNGLAHWLHCSACQLSGAPLELAAAATPLAQETSWEQALTATVQSLIKSEHLTNVSSEQVSLYVADSCRRRQLQEAWQHARQQAYARLRDDAKVGATLREACFHWGLAVPLTEVAWDKGLGRFLGVMTRVEAKELPWYPGRVGGPAELPHRYAYLVLACHDLPGRLVGCIFLSTKPGQEVYRFTAPGAYTRLSVRRGLALTEALPPRPDPVLITDSVAQALRAYSRHFEAGYEDGLALAALFQPRPPGRRVDYTPIRSSAGPEPLAGRAAVLWGATLSPQLLAQALELRAQLCVEPLPHGPVQLGAVSVSQWLQGLCSRAKPWWQHLSSILDTLTPVQALALLKQLDLLQEDSPNRAGLPALLLRQLERVLTSQGPRSVQTRLGLVTEQDGCWWLRLSQQHELKEYRHPLCLLADFIVRVETIQLRGQGALAWGKASGYVEYAGRRAVFEEDLTLLRRQGFAWAERSILAAGLGIPVWGHLPPELMLLLALRFHRPRLERVLET